MKKKVNKSENGWIKSHILFYINNKYFNDNWNLKSRNMQTFITLFLI